MIKLLWRLVLLLVAASGLVWLAENPGNITIHWRGQDIELSVFVGVLFLATFIAAILMLVWLFRRIWRAPSALLENRKSRREKRAYEALSRGIIAAGAGDGATAARHAAVAGATLKNEPLVKLLGAQAAQLRGDKAEVGRVFEDMSQKEDTALLGLRGLHAQARERGDWLAAGKHAEAAHARNGRLTWAQQAMLNSHTRNKDWIAASKIVEQMAKSGAWGRTEASKAQAALLTAAALTSESTDKAAALKFANEAHVMDGALVPAALIMARCFSSQSQPKRALKVLRETFAKFPHRDLALAAAAVIEDSPEDQFERVRDLVGKDPVSSEGKFALAQAAVAAKRFDAARDILKHEEPSIGVCTLMAQIEEANSNHAEAKTWLKRGLAGQVEPVWMSDGVALAQWAAVSPVSGEIVPCEWRRPQNRASVPLLAAHVMKETVAAAPTTEKLLAPPRPPDDPGVE